MPYEDPPPTGCLHASGGLLLLFAILAAIVSLPWLLYYPLWYAYIGALVAVAIAGIAMMWIAHRRATRQDKCPHCGYDLRYQSLNHAERGGTLRGCPECGWGRDS